MSTSLLMVALLTLVYTMVLGSYDPWDIAFGAAASMALLAASRGFLSHQRTSVNLPLGRRIVAFFPFAGAVVWDIVKGTWVVVQVVLHRRPLKHPGIVLIPIGDRTPTGVAVSALATTLSPGTFLVDVDWERRVMLIHAIDASDPAGLRASFEEFYNRWQRAVFP